MRYLLTVYADETLMPDTADAHSAAAYAMSPPFVAYKEALEKAGAYLGGDRLRPAATATTLRVNDGKTELLNGPYVDTKEQLGGYFIIEAPDHDAALAWASRCPGAAIGAVEVRPIWEKQQ